MAKRTGTGKKSKTESTGHTDNKTEESLNQENSYIILPDVRDIPGQENIEHAGVPEEMADTTISSDDEEGIREGKDMLEETDDVEIVMGTGADVTKDDLALLGDRDHDMDMGEDETILKQGLDDTDADGDPLNEAASDVDTTGDDLDIPGASDNDPEKDSMGQDDEENSYYSLGSDDNDQLKESTP